jgi:hypothetical protein
MSVRVFQCHLCYGSYDSAASNRARRNHRRRNHLPLWSSLVVCERQRLAVCDKGYQMSRQGDCNDDSKTQVDTD